jgi:integrase
VSVHRHEYADGRVGYYVKHQGRTAARFDPRKYGGTRECKRLADEHNLKLLTGQRPDAGKALVCEVAVRWWDRHVVTLAAETQATYATQLDKRVLPRWGGVQVRMVTPQAVEEWMDDLRRRKAGAPTVRTCLAVLSGIMARAVTDGETPANPARAVAWPSSERQREPVMVPPVFVERARLGLLEGGRVMDATLLSVLAYAGPRPESEALPLSWDRVQLGRGEIVFSQTKRKGDPVDRAVTLLEPLADDLRAWRKHGGAVKAQGPVFPHAWAGHGWDNWRDRVFRPAMIAAGWPADTERKRTRRGKTVVVKSTSLRPRDLRASYVSLLVFSGMNPVEVAGQTGHSVEVMQRLYAGVFRGFDPAARRPAADVIAEARAEALGWMVTERDRTMGA